MKLFRRKPEYAMAMEVVRDDSGTEYAVQPCDESGKPLTSHLQFFSQEEFARQYEPFRVRVRDRKKKTTPSRSRNGPPKTKTPQVESEVSNA